MVTGWRRPHVEATAVAQQVTEEKVEAVAGSSEGGGGGGGGGEGAGGARGDGGHDGRLWGRSEFASPTREPDAAARAD